MRPHRPCQELRKLSGSRSIWLRHRRFATPAKCQGCGRKARIIAANEVYPVSVWQDSPSGGCSRVLMRHAPPRACTAAFLVDDKASGRPCRCEARATGQRAKHAATPRHAPYPAHGRNTGRSVQSGIRPRVESLADRRLRPGRCRNTFTEENVCRMLALRKMRMTGDETALRPGFCRGGVFRALRKPECSRLASLEEKLPVARYHREMPGQMPHLDIMRLGKTEELGGIEKHACGKAIVAGRAGNIRACALMTRPAPPHIRQYSRMKPLDQRWNSSGLPLRGMPRMGLKWRACLRTMAPAANWKLRDACRESGIKHKCTRPYRPPPALSCAPSRRRPCRRTLPAIYKSGAAYVMLVKAWSREFHPRHASISPEFGCRKIERCSCNISRLIHSRQFRVLNATFFCGIPG